jgi:hypothetical protein
MPSLAGIEIAPLVLVPKSFDQRNLPFYAEARRMYALWTSTRTSFKELTK